jgi:ADP-heptose:LPS heptosyltransferase
MDAAKRRFPAAEIRFAGHAKNYELFAADPRVRHIPVEYRRGALWDRIEAWRAIPPDDLVLDPDSRLTQLGLLPVGDDERYRLFESRGYGGGSDLPLPQLAARWCEETLGVSGARPYLALCAAPAAPPGGIAVSLGVGENPAKRLPDPFEEELLRILGAAGLPLAIDSGAGGEERDRVERALVRSGASATLCRGSFAEFAATIATSRLYVGYDSAGQHVAAATGIPLVSVFAGFPVERMFHRWRPVAPSATVLRIDDPNPMAALARVRAALDKALL